LLHICDYLPIIQAKILDLIIGKCLEIDVEIVIEDSGEVKIVEDYDGENDDDIFQLDDDQGEFNTNNNNSSRQTHRGKIEDYYRIPLEVVEMSDKLDAILVLVIQYIDNIISPTSTKSKEIKDKFFQQLLSIFEVRILTTYKSKFVQYLIFFTAAKDEKFGFIFLKWLLRMFFDDKNQSHIKRQSAIVYIASFMSRSNFISTQVVFDILSELLAWANSYVISTGAISHSLNIDGSIIDVDVYKNEQKYYQNVDHIEVLLPQENSLSMHETFYCCVQAVCYILCFHGKEMAILQKNNEIMRNHWEVIITSSHFPLR
jgi:RNA polymerase I-specific transcription initiation factor RRN3